MTITQLDRIEERIEGIDRRLRGIEVKLAGDDGERRVTDRLHSTRWYAVVHAVLSPLVSAALAIIATLHFYGGK